MRKVNYKSDFDFILRLLDCKGEELGWPGYDFTARFWTSSRASAYEASCIGGVCRNCRNDNGQIRVYLDNHGLGAGDLRMEFTAMLPDDGYPDGNRRDVRTIDLDIRLVREAAPCQCPTEADVELMLPYIKGEPFTYADFTPEQIEELQRPATEAANQLETFEAETTRRLDEAENKRAEAESAREEAERRREEVIGSFGAVLDSKADRTELSNIYGEPVMPSGSAEEFLPGDGGDGAVESRITIGLPMRPGNRLEPTVSMQLRESTHGMSVEPGLPEESDRAADGDSDDSTSTPARVYPYTTLNEVLMGSHGYETTLGLAIHRSPDIELHSVSAQLVESPDSSMTEFPSNPIDDSPATEVSSRAAGIPVVRPENPKNPDKLKTIPVLALSDSARHAVFDDLWLAVPGIPRITPEGEMATIPRTMVDYTHTEDIEHESGRIETVLKPYCLNGIWMTYEEAINVYTLWCKTPASGAYNHAGIKANLPFLTERGPYLTTLDDVFANSDIQCADLGGYNFDMTETYGMFRGCTSLKTIKTPLRGSFDSGAFYACRALRDVYITAYSDVYLGDSPELSYESLEGVVSVGIGGLDIGTRVFTVHEDVYAKLTGDTANAAAAALTEEELARWMGLVPMAKEVEVEFSVKDNTSGGGIPGILS